jgi:hypothetical protein
MIFFHSDVRFNYLTAAPIPSEIWAPCSLMYKYLCVTKTSCLPFQRTVWGITFLRKVSPYLLLYYMASISRRKFLMILRMLNDLFRGHGFGLKEVGRWKLGLQFIMPCRPVEGFRHLKGSPSTRFHLQSQTVHLFTTSNWVQDKKRGELVM